MRVGMDDQVERALPSIGSRHSEVRGQVSDSPQPEPRSRVSTLTFFVPGLPIPKGSKTIFQGRLVESSKAYPAWSELVGDTAAIEKAKVRWKLDLGPCTVLLDFVLREPQRPKDTRHVTKPDLDKLIRGVLDPLTGVLWHDDAQVDKLVASKHYGAPTGVTIVVVGSRS